MAESCGHIFSLTNARSAACPFSAASTPPATPLAGPGISLRRGVACCHISHVILSGSRYCMATVEEMIFPCARKKDPSAKGSTDVTWAADVEFQRRCWLFLFYVFFMDLFRAPNSRGSSCAFSSCPAWKSHQILVPKLSLCPSFQSEGECYDALLCSDYCCDKQAGTTESSRDNVKVDNFCGPTAGSFTVWQGLQHSCHFGYNSSSIRWDLDHCDPWNFCCKFAPSKTCR